MAKFDFGTLIGIGAILGKAAYDDSQVKKNNETEEYQEELKSNIEELEKQSDVELLTEFHKEYDDNDGRGLFVIDTGNRMDSMFMAYMDVFKKRGMKRLEARCCECDKRLGYRMATKEYKVIKDEYELTHGYCECRCGKSRSWVIQYDGNDKSCIHVHNF